MEENKENPYKKLLNESSEVVQLVPSTRIMPKKANFRMRAHCNPLNTVNFAFPKSLENVDWSLHYEQNEKLYCNSNLYSAVEHPITYSEDPVPQPENKVEILDVGCGYGGLLFSLSGLFPQTRILGLEIRNKITNYVSQKIWASRIENPGQVTYNQYWNISVLRTNAMQLLPNYFSKGQLTKLFFCFADPNFKKSHHKRRIINSDLLDTYADLLKPSGRIYAITDVYQLHEWHVKHLNSHSSFREVPEEDYTNDPCVQIMNEATEEGKKVARNGGSKYYCVYERISDSTH